MFSSTKTTVVAVVVTSVMAMASNAAKADYLIMELKPTAHVVLMTDKCPRTPIFVPNANEKVGYIVDGSQKLSGCWSKDKGEIYFTLQTTGSSLYYPAKDFRYISPLTYDKKYGNTNYQTMGPKSH